MRPIQQLKRVVALQPKDTISARLFQQLERPDAAGWHGQPTNRPAGARARADADSVTAPNGPVRKVGWKGRGPLSPIRRPRSR